MKSRKGISHLSLNPIKRLIIEYPFVIVSNNEAFPVPCSFGKLNPNLSNILVPFIAVKILSNAAA